MENGYIIIKQIGIILLMLGFILPIIKLIFSRFIKKIPPLKKYVYVFFICGYVKLVLIYLNINNNHLNTVLFLGLIYSTIKIIDFYINDYILERKSKQKFPKLMRSVIILTVFLISLFIILRYQLGINLTPFLTTSAVISMVVGLALQDTLTNFISGIILHMEKTFKKGDIIEVGEVVGKVVDINWRATKIYVLGEGLASIPNGYIIREEAINYFNKTKYLLRIKIGASYNDPPNLVEKTLLEIAQKNQNILKEPAPEVWLDGYGNHSIDYELRIWAHQEFYERRRIEAQIYKSIWYAFNRNGIKIPYPVREIYNVDIQKDNKELESKKELLEKVDIFNNTDNNIIDKLANELKLKRYGKEENLFFEGDPGDSFFIIENGKVEVLVKGKRVATLSEGDFFGEMSLLTGKERNATIRILEDSEIFVLDKKGFSKVIMENEEVLKEISNIIAKREIGNKKVRAKILDQEKYNKKDEINKMEKSIFRKIQSFFEL